MFFRMRGERIGASERLGGRSRTSSVGASVAKDSDANESMIKLTHSIWKVRKSEMCEVIGLVDLDSREWRFLQPDGSGAGSDHGDHIDRQLKLQEFCDA